MEWIIAALIIGLIWLTVYTVRMGRGFVAFAKAVTTNLTILQRDNLINKLQQAVDREDYETAAKIRDLIKKQ